MTIWGPTENNCRIGIDFHDLPTITKDTASITVGADLRWYSGGSVTDNTNTTYWDWLGYSTDPDGSDADALKLTSFSGMKYFKSVTRPVSLVYGSAQSVTLNAWVSPLEFVGDKQLDVSATLTVPARPFQLPRAPIGAAVTKNSDTSHTITWTGDYTDNAGGYPWSDVYVQRWDNVTDTWTQIASLAYTATSYTDTTTVADRQYQYRVIARNSSGYSTYSTTGYTTTTPAAHTNIAWTKSTSDVVLTWTKASTLPATTEVEESAGGGAWTAKATVAAGTNTWTHTSPNPAVTHQYRVRPVSATVPGAWITSTVVQLLAPPLAPTALAPSGVTVDPNDGSVAVTWQHNPGDGTSQTAYEHQIKESGGSYTSSGKVTSTASARSLSGLVRGKTYVHKSRTWGQHATAGPWSAEQSFTTGARPQAALTYPTAANYGKSSLTIAWTYYDLEGGAHTGSQLELVQGATVVYSTTLSGASTSFQLPYDLANTTSYKARARVLDPSGQWSNWAEQTFSTVFVPPTTPTVSGVFDPATGAVTLTITNPDADGMTTVDPVSNTVYRSIDGSEELVAAGLPINTTWTDAVPTTSGTNTYRVVAWSATPTSADSAPLDLVCYSPWLFVNGGPGNSTVARLKGGPAVQLAAGRHKVLHQFVGRTFPLEFTGTARARAYSVSGAVDGFGAETDLWGSWEAWEAVADLPAPLIYRDPLGRREYVSISGVTIDHDSTSKKARVSATLTVVDHG